MTVDSNSNSAVELAGIRPERRFADSELANIGSFSDALNLLNENQYSAVDYAEKYGTGFKVLDTKDKGQLCDVPFMALEWSFNEGDQGTFVSLAIVTEAGQKLILNDGSTGILAQMIEVTRDRMAAGATLDEATHGLLVRNGLRKSEYPTDETGKPLTKDDAKNHPELIKGTGVTYYLNN